MILEVGVVQDVVNESSGVLHACGIGGRIGSVEGEVEGEVGVFLLYGQEVVEVEDFVQGASAVEVGHLPIARVERLGHVHNLCAQGGHTGATADPDHLVLGIEDRVEVAIGAAHFDLVTRLEGEDVRGCDAGHDVHESHLRLRLEGRGGDADGQHEAVALGRIVGHGIGADRLLVVAAFEGEEAELFPRGQVLGADGVFVDVDVVIHREFGDVDLSVGAGDEVHVLARGQGNDELLDEGGHVLVRDHGALVLLDAEDFVGHLHRHVVPDLRLAGQSPVVFHLFAAEEDLFGGQNVAASLDDLRAALAAFTAATAGGGEEDVAALKGSEQGAADGRFDFFFAVDGQLDVARRHELGFCNQQQYDQQQHDDEKHRYAGSDRQS